MTLHCVIEYTDCIRLIVLFFPQVAVSVPEEDGVTVHSATQYIDFTQAAVAQVLGIPIRR